MVSWGGGGGGDRLGGWGVLQIIIKKLGIDFKQRLWVFIYLFNLSYCVLFYSVLQLHVLVQCPNLTVARSPLAIENDDERLKTHSKVARLATDLF